MGFNPPKLGILQMVSRDGFEELQLSNVIDRI